MPFAPTLSHLCQRTAMLRKLCAVRARRSCPRPVIFGGSLRLKTHDACGMDVYPASGSILSKALRQIQHGPLACPETIPPGG